MSAPVTLRTTDHSDRESFSFSFFCDICSKAWQSPAALFNCGGSIVVENDEAWQMIWAAEHKIAFEHANLDARTKFSRCPICGKYVCDDCFIFGTSEEEMCKECKGNKQCRP